MRASCIAKKARASSGRQASAREDVGQEAGPLLHVGEPLGEVGGQVLAGRHGEAADRELAHRSTVPIPARPAAPGRLAG